MVDRSLAILLLQNSGWFPERSVDPAPYRAYLEERGLLYCNATERFFANFGGLMIHFTTIYGKKDAIKFNILDFPMIDKEVLSDDDTVLGVQLSFLGSYSDGMFIMTMDQYGNIYSSTSGEIYKLGQDTVEAVARIVGGLPVETVRRPKDWMLL